MELSRIQDGFEVGVVESDGLTVVVTSLLELAAQRCDEAEQVVGLWGFGVELEGTPSGGLRTDRIAALDEIPASVEVRGELVHWCEQEVCEGRAQVKRSKERSSTMTVEAAPQDLQGMEKASIEVRRAAFLFVSDDECSFVLRGRPNSMPPAR